jgi:hypothetical protein
LSRFVVVASLCEPISAVLVLPALLREATVFLPRGPHVRVASIGNRTVVSKALARAGGHVSGGHVSAGNPAALRP